MTPTSPALFTLPHDSTLDDLLQTIRERSSLQLAAWKREEQVWRDRVTLSEGQIRMLQEEVTKLRDALAERDELIEAFQHTIEYIHTQSQGSPDNG